MRTLYSLLLAAFVALSLAAQEQPPNAVLRLDPALDTIVSPDAKVEKLAGGFLFLEGPVWVRKGGYLIFSDIPGNVIDKWDSKTGKITTFLQPSGFTGTDRSGVGREQTNGKATVLNYGSNGITLDRQGRIVFNAMGDRAVVRIEKNGKRTVLIDRYDGMRLNSTNDIVVKKDGAIYFTDPPSALPKGNDDPKKEMPFNGVFLLKNGMLTLLAKDLLNPNGLAFSPDEKVFYVDDTTKRNVLRFDVLPDDTVTNGRVLVDMSGEKATGNPDGMKVDVKGNVYCTGAGGIWVITPEGKHLGTLAFPEQPANLAFGDADGKTLYVTARTGLYRIHVKIAGIRP